MRNTSRKGQALVELAVFGSLLLLLLGYVINNALTYDYQQSATMGAFRRGLASAAGSSLDDAPVSTSHLVIQDRHIPDPSDPFGLGSVTPVTAQADVTRKYNLQNVPGNSDSLPKLMIEIENAGPARSYTLAGFRDEIGVPSSSLERYRFVYGGHGGFVCDKPECGGGDGGCSQTGDPVMNPETGEMDLAPCLVYAKHLKIVDSCAGEIIINRESCRSQVEQIMDSGACERACNRAGMPNCAGMCSQSMQPPPYAAAVLASTAPMGLQPGSTQTITKNNQLATTENAGGIQTTSSIDLTETTERTVLRSDGNTETITANRNETSSTPWSTSW